MRFMSTTDIWHRQWRAVLSYSVSMYLLLLLAASCCDGQGDEKANATANWEQSGVELPGRVVHVDRCHLQYDDAANASYAQSLKSDDATPMDCDVETWVVCDSSNALPDGLRRFAADDAIFGHDEVTRSAVLPTSAFTERPESVQEDTTLYKRRRSGVVKEQSQPLSSSEAPLHNFIGDDQSSSPSSSSSASPLSSPPSITPRPQREKYGNSYPTLAECLDQLMDAYEVETQAKSCLAKAGRRRPPGRHCNSSSGSAAMREDGAGANSEGSNTTASLFSRSISALGLFSWLPSKGMDSAAVEAATATTATSNASSAASPSFHSALDWVPYLRHLPVFSVETALRHLEHVDDDHVFLALFYAPDLFGAYNFVPWLRLMAQTVCLLMRAGVMEVVDYTFHDNSTAASWWEEAAAQHLGSRWRQWSPGTGAPPRRSGASAATAICSQLRLPSLESLFSPEDVLLMQRNGVRVAIIDAFYPPHTTAEADLGRLIHRFSDDCSSSSGGEVWGAEEAAQRDALLRLALKEGPHLMSGTNFASVQSVAKLFGVVVAGGTPMADDLDLDESVAPSAAAPVRGGSPLTEYHGALFNSSAATHFPFPPSAVDGVDSQSSRCDAAAILRNASLLYNSTVEEALSYIDSVACQLQNNGCPSARTHPVLLMASLMSLQRHIYQRRRRLAELIFAKGQIAKYRLHATVTSQRRTFFSSSVFLSDLKPRATDVADGGDDDAVPGDEADAATGWSGWDNPTETVYHTGFAEPSKMEPQHRGHNGSRGGTTIATRACTKAAAEDSGLGWLGDVEPRDDTAAMEAWNTNGDFDDDIESESEVSQQTSSDIAERAPRGVGSCSATSPLAAAAVPQACIATYSTNDMNKDGDQWTDLDPNRHVAEDGEEEEEEEELPGARASPPSPSTLSSMQDHLTSTARLNFMLRQTPPLLLFPRKQGSRPFLFPQTQLRLVPLTTLSTGEQPTPAAFRQQLMQHWGSGAEEDDVDLSIPTVSTRETGAASRESRRADTAAAPPEKSSTVAGTDVAGLSASASGIAAPSRFRVLSLFDTPFSRVAAQYLHHEYMIHGPSSPKVALRLLVEESRRVSAEGELAYRTRREELYQLHRQEWLREHSHRWAPIRHEGSNGAMGLDMRGSTLSAAQVSAGERATSAPLTADHLMTLPEYESLGAILAMEPSFLTEFSERSSADAETTAPDSSISAGATEAETEAVSLETVAEFPTAASVLGSGRAPSSEAATPVVTADGDIHAPTTSTGATMTTAPTASAADDGSNGTDEDYFFLHDAAIRLDPQRFAENTPLSLHFFLRTPPKVVEEEIIVPLRQRVVDLRKELLGRIVADARRYGNCAVASTHFAVAFNRLLIAGLVGDTDGSTLPSLFRPVVLRSLLDNMPLTQPRNASLTEDNGDDAALLAVLQNSCAMSFWASTIKRHPRWKQLDNATATRLLSPQLLLQLLLNRTLPSPLFADVPPMDNAVVPGAPPVVAQDNHDARSRSNSRDSSAESGDTAERYAARRRLALQDRAVLFQLAWRELHRHWRFSFFRLLFVSAAVVEEAVPPSSQADDCSILNGTSPCGAGTGKDDTFPAGDAAAGGEAARALRCAEHTDEYIAVMYLFTNRTADSYYHLHEMNRQRFRLRWRLDSVLQLARQARFLLQTATEEDHREQHLHTILQDSKQRHRMIYQIATQMNKAHVAAERTQQQQQQQGQGGEGNVTAVASDAPLSGEGATREQPSCAATDATPTPLPATTPTMEGPSLSRDQSPLKSDSASLTAATPASPSASTSDGGASDDYSGDRLTVLSEQLQQLLPFQFNILSYEDLAMIPQARWDSTEAVLSSDEQVKRASTTTTTSATFNSAAEKATSSGSVEDVVSIPVDAATSGHETDIFASLSAGSVPIHAPGGSGGGNDADDYGVAVATDDELNTLSTAPGVAGKATEMSLLSSDVDEVHRSPFEEELMLDATNDDDDDDVGEDGGEENDPHRGAGAARNGAAALTHRQTNHPREGSRVSRRRRSRAEQYHRVQQLKRRLLDERLRWAAARWQERFYP